MTTRLIERWLPIAALGEECMRERRSMTALPPVYYLHVWWARRPLVASRAAVLGSLLPADADHEKFMHALGIHGDPVHARQVIDKAKRTGQRVENPYGYDRAFQHVPDDADLEWLRSGLQTLGLREPRLLDPTAGGGSIPFESVRLGLATAANDLNNVAALVLRATVEWPALHGADVVAEFRRLAQAWRNELGSLLPHLFPAGRDRDEVDATYLWARTIRCPHCAGLVPLSPNWRLAPDGTGVRLHPQTRSKDRRCSFAIVGSAAEQSGATVAGGDGKCPFPDCERVIDGDEIKRQAQAGAMGEQLFAVVVRRRVVTPGKVLKSGKRGKDRVSWERGFRSPRPDDDNAESIEAMLTAKMPELEARGVVPTEEIASVSNYDRGHRMYGMTRYRDLFTARQLLCHSTSVQVYRDLLDQETSKGPLSAVTKAALGYLGITLDKCLDYNSKLSAWHAGREVMEHTFRDHAYVLKWSFAEMAPLVSGLGYDWAIEQTTKCMRELVALVRPDANASRRSDEPSLFPAHKAPPVAITCGSADSLHHIETASIDAIVMDPPYGSNDMYAELSDFFYVWLKRTVGHVYPEFFRRSLTDKESEAIANPAKFKGQRGSLALATRDYRERMSAIFAECSRVLKPDSIMTVMFTHKDTGAWDALTMGLMQAGFSISASWPVPTEAEDSLHIKEKSAANSTIFLGVFRDSCGFRRDWIPAQNAADSSEA